jgi:hypothetical protein
LEGLTIYNGTSRSRERRAREYAMVNICLDALPAVCTNVSSHA